MNGYPWQSLKAAILRYGVYHSKTAGMIDLPDGLLRCFQEPLALVWSTHMLKEIRNRNAQLAQDTLTLVTMVHDWARKNAEVKLAPSIIARQEQNLKDRVEQMKTQGRE